MDLNKTSYSFYDEEIISPDPEEINRSRKEENFTDLILCTPDGNKYSVHKIIIATRCTYFKGLFHSGLMESTLAEIQLDRNISEEIINYIYTGRIEITSENALIISGIAHFFGLTKLKEATEKVLVNNINIKNILTHWRWAEKYSNYVEKKSLDFILKNTEIFLEKHLLSLNYDEITIIATNTDLADEMLYVNLVKWIKGDFENRENYIEDLLKYVSLAELSDDFRMKEIQTDEVLFSNIKFLRLMALNKKSMCRVNQPKKREITTDLDDLVFAISDYQIAVLELKKPKARLAPIIQHDFKWDFEPIYFKEDKILFCGVDYGKKECKSFSYQTNVFNDISPMLESRLGFGVTKLHDKIYVCGGLKKNGSVEIYDYNIDKWIYGKSMSKDLCSFKTVNYNESIYTFGGYEMYDTSYRHFKIIQRYDPREDIWEIVCSNAIAMTQIAVAFVVKENAIRCIYKTDDFAVSVCGYDVRNNNMFEVPSEIPAIRFCSSYQSKDNVYIIGSKLNQPKTTFGQLENLTTSDPVKFTEFPDIDLSAWNGKGYLEFVNVGPDQYNYLDSI